VFGERKVNLQLTERAKEFIERYKAKTNLKSPILSIGWAKFNRETEERWYVGFQDRNDVREGWVGIAPDFEFVVVQEWILDQMDDRVLDIDDGRGMVTVQPRDSA